MPVIDRSASTTAVTPTAPTQRGGQIKTVARLDDITLRADANQKVTMQLDVPLSSFVPPLDAAAVRAEGNLIIHLPPNSLGVRPVQLVDGPKGPALRLELEGLDAGAVIQTPITFDIGSAATLGQLVNMGAMGQVPVSSGRFKGQVQLKSVSMDRTAWVLGIEKENLHQADVEVSRQQQTVEDVRTRRPAATGLRQLESQLANAQAVLAATVQQTAAYQQAARTFLEGQPPSARVAAVVGDGAVIAAWEAFRTAPTPANTASWSAAMKTFLATATDATCVSMAKLLDASQLPAAPKLSVWGATAEVDNLTLELQQRRALIANSPDELTEAVERLTRLRANRDARAATVSALEKGQREVMTVPTSYEPSMLF